MIAQPSEEQVYVVPRVDLFPHGAPHGCMRAEPELFRSIYTHGRFEPRAQVETEPDLKQIIPYAVVVHEDEVFLFRRTHKGGEERLFGLRSVGVGGHVNPEDASDVVHAGLRRELEEELVMPPAWQARVVGLLNDDSTAVGSVHLGVVAVVRAGPGTVRVREEDTMAGSFVSWDDLRELHARERDSFESWSALLLDRLDEVLAWERQGGFSSPTPNATPTSST